MMLATSQGKHERRMTLDEAIKHAEEVAEKFESLHERYENMDEDRLLFRVEENECKNCANEHRQLAEWLKELKQLRKQEKTGHWIDHSDEGYVECSNCGSATNCDGNIADLHFCFSCGAEMESEE